MSSESLNKSKAVSRWFRCIIISLLVTVVTLGLIIGLKIEMQGYGAYLYLLVSAAAFMYILSTVIFVILSVRHKSAEAQRS